MRQLLPWRDLAFNFLFRLPLTVLQFAARLVEDLTDHLLDDTLDQPWIWRDKT